MQLFRFSGDTARPITDYGSSFHLARLLWSRAGEVRVDIAFLKPGDHIELPQAGLPQLLCVITGAGWVQGGDRREAAMGNGMPCGLATAIVQAEALDPAAFLLSDESIGE